MPIPASKLVTVTPGVLSAGSGELQFNGMILTDSPLLSEGAPRPFTSAAGVTDFFGADSIEARMARVYFGGFGGAKQVPEKIYFARYGSMPIVGSFTLEVTPLVPNIDWGNTVEGVFQNLTATQTLHVKITRLNGYNDLIDFYWPVWLAGGWTDFTCTIDGMNVTQAMGQNTFMDGWVNDGTGLNYRNCPDEFDIVFTGKRAGWAAGRFDPLYANAFGTTFYAEGETDPSKNASTPNVTFTHNPFYWIEFDPATTGWWSRPTLTWNGGQDPTPFPIDVAVFAVNGYSGTVEATLPKVDGTWGLSFKIWDPANPPYNSSLNPIPFSAIGTTNYVQSRTLTGPECTAIMELQATSDNQSDWGFQSAWQGTPGLLVTTTDGIDTVLSNYFGYDIIP